MEIFPPAPFIKLQNSPKDKNHLGRLKKVILDVWKKTQQQHTYACSWTPTNPDLLSQHFWEWGRIDRWSDRLSRYVQSSGKTGQQCITLVGQSQGCYLKWLTTRKGLGTAYSEKTLAVAGGLEVLPVPSLSSVVQDMRQAGKSKQHVWGYLSCVGTTVELEAMAFY